MVALSGSLRRRRSVVEQARWSRHGHGSPVRQSSSSEECSRAGEVESAWAWQPSRLVSAASEEKAIGAHGPVRTGGESVDDGRGLFATAAKCRLTSGTGLLLGGDEGDRDGGKVQVDDGHGLFARKRRRCPDREYLYGIYAS